MGGQKSKANVSTSSKNVVTTTTVSSHAIHPRHRIAQNFLLIWMDASIDQSKQDCQNTLAQLRSVVNDVNIFNQLDECVDFLTEVDDMKAFLIVEGTLGKQIVPLIHDVSQLDGVYIFCSNKSRHEQWVKEWVKEWVKVKGIHTEITTICKSLRQAVKQYDQDSITVSFVAVDEGASNQNLDQLESSFMYTQIFKEILLEMEYDRQSIKAFTTYCRNGDYGAPSNIDRFENEYSAKSAIWWYTFPSFICSMLNYAFRTLEAETIIKMGFLVRDLHHQIEELHRKQVGSYHEKSFIVYRGQGISKTDFEKLLKTKDGLISFNNFLSTSKIREVSLGFAQSTLEKTDTVGILFEMSIDPSISSTPFACVQAVSSFQQEEEILFSMHTVFRIGEITKIDNNSSLYQVKLKLTADDDQQLRTLTNRIREETAGEKGWTRLGMLLAKVGQFDKAEELYTVLLDQASIEREKARYYNNLGYLKDHQGDYEKAIGYYEKSLAIYGKTLPPNHPDMATLYNNIGIVYDNMREYSKALSFYEKALEIYRKTLPRNHPDLANSYNNIGLAYAKMEECSKALSFYEEALEIYRKILPSNHPSLANSYNNIGGVYDNMGEYSKALSFYEKALEIQQKTLPPNHPLLATSYNNIGLEYDEMGEYSKALSFCEKSLEIRQKNVPPNYPSLATSYNSIGSVYNNMGEHSKALSFYEKSLEICQKNVPPNQNDLAMLYNNVASVYHDMGEYCKALSFHEKALETWQKTLPPNHPLLATSYNNIGIVYDNMGKHSKALSFHEKALEIRQKTLSQNHPSLATSYNNIGEVYYNMGEYSKALSFYKKSLEIRQKTLSQNHPSLATSYNNIGLVYNNMGEYSKALSFHEKVIEIRQKTLPPNHSDMAQFYNNIGGVYDNMGDYLKALSFYERALNALQSSLPLNHPNIKTVQDNIELLKKEIMNYV